MSFEVPDDLRYRETHEWISVDETPARVGITDFAQDELGDIVFVELPDAGRTLGSGEQFGTVESIKATSELYLPASGTVTAVNEELDTSPELVNDEPYGAGWMLEVEVGEAAELDGLMTATQYREQTE